MKLLDTNILIYSGQSGYGYLRALITDPECVVSIIAKVESLGYHKIKPEEVLYLEGVFTLLPILGITSQTAEKAIELRQQKKLSLGDALMAATAIVGDLTLYTHNTDDFKNITGLNIFDPIKSDAGL